MVIEWTLGKKHVLGLIACASILPVALVASAAFGSWVLLVGMLVSLPLAPIGFMAFRGGTSVSIPFACLLAWVFNILQGWVVLIQYVATTKVKGTQNNQMNPPGNQASAK